MEQRCEQWRRRSTRRTGSRPPPAALQTYGILTLVVGSFGRDYVLDTRKYFISLLWHLRGSPLKSTEDSRLSTRTVAPDRGEEQSEIKRHWKRFDDSANHSVKMLEKHFKQTILVHLLQTWPSNTTFSLSKRRHRNLFHIAFDYVGHLTYTNLYSVTQCNVKVKTNRLKY